MTSGWWTAGWIWAATGWTLLALGVVLLVWALFWDRSRGRKRCPKCWYDLGGVVAANAAGPWVCSECGKETTNERRLRKTRWHKWWASLGLVLALGGFGCTLVLQVTNHGWWSLLPTNRITDLMPVTGRDGLFANELMKRMGWSGSMWSGGSKLTEEEEIYLLNRIRYGSVIARPGSSRWLDTYGLIPGRCIRLVDLGFAGHANRIWTKRSAAVTEAIKKLYDLPLYVEVNTRKPWPKDSPLYISVHAVSAWPWPTGWGVRLVRKDTGETICDGRNEGGVIRGLKEGKGVLDIDLFIDQLRQAEHDAKDMQIEQRSLCVSYQIAGTVAGMMTPVAKKALDDLVAGITYEVGDGWVSTQVDSTRVTATKDLAFGVILEHQFDGVTMYRERMWWRGGQRTSPLDELFAEREWIGGTRNAWMAKPGEKWTIHIVSDAETALRVTDATTYWTGEASIQVSNQKTKDDR